LTGAAIVQMPMSTKCENLQLTLASLVSGTLTAPVQHRFFAFQFRENRFQIGVFRSQTHIFSSQLRIFSPRFRVRVPSSTLSTKSPARTRSRTAAATIRHRLAIAENEVFGHLVATDLEYVMPHQLELKYGLTAQELLDAIDKRFRLKVALEGAVAEVHFERKVRIAAKEGWLTSYESHDLDGLHDFTVVTLSGVSIRVEVKTIRNGPKPQVELQKTRAAKGDPSSRYYNRNHFDVVAVCVGRLTGDWAQFRYALVNDLPYHRDYSDKLKVMHAIPESEETNPRWFSRFQDVIDAFSL